MFGNINKFEEEYLEMAEENNVKYEPEYFLNFLMIFINGNKYSGALHLWFPLQINCYKYQAALPLQISRRLCRS